ncbi:hypothetical protein AAG570_013194 [Ranatra chinensis]|uniref:Uncharacterized protein n=1 Tax=Ranatra chinensis TaxID=642074 RepID=A0ABD0YG26_9HEMI
MNVMPTSARTPADTLRRSMLYKFRTRTSPKTLLAAASCACAASIRKVNSCRSMECPSNSGIPLITSINMVISVLMESIVATFYAAKDAATATSSRVSMLTLLDGSRRSPNYKPPNRPVPRSDPR